MKYLIIGRTGRGKDTIAKALESRGLVQLKSYTTREPRYEGEDTHIFITKEEASKYSDKVARTEINGVEYFATRKQLEESDIYVIDPRGFYELTKNCPDVSFRIIYMSTNDETARQRAMARGDDPEKEGRIFDSRSADEDEQFSDFEAKLEARKEPLAPNALVSHWFTNEDDNPEALDNFASYLYGLFIEFKNVRHIVERGVELGFLHQSRIGYVDTMRYDENGETVKAEEPFDIFTDIVLSDPDGFERCMHAYLSSEIIYDEI